MQKTSSENEYVSQCAETLKKNNDCKNEMSSTFQPKETRSDSQVIAEEMLTVP